MVRDSCSWPIMCDDATHGVQKKRRPNRPIFERVYAKATGINAPGSKQPYRRNASPPKSSRSSPPHPAAAGFLLLAAPSCLTGKLRYHVKALCGGFPPGLYRSSMPGLRPELDCDIQVVTLEAPCFNACGGDVFALAALRCHLPCVRDVWCLWGAHDVPGARHHTLERAERGQRGGRERRP